ncbi:hypothetical protein [Spirillospora sp. NBC_01491]|uniref:hypothetical protein n=1 Tax=Spirillospora sp. NBC_01491 TaxID=2976007 RepID=UPI002E350EB8|nr:hypothetical protein [Spirillospora sp. NBC_01491]
MRTRARRTANLAFAATLAFGGILSAAPGCTTNTCVNGSCTVTFKDGARETTVGGLGDLKVSLTGVDGVRARVTIGGTRATLTRGSRQPVGAYQVEATEVTAEKVVLKVSR